MKLEETYFNRNVEQAVVGCSKRLFEAKTQPTLYLASQIGNMYTPSLYGGLISLLIKYVLTFLLFFHHELYFISIYCSTSVDSLLGKTVGMFSYGSGLASSMFSLRVSKDASLLEPLSISLKDVLSRLEARRAVPPVEFTAVLKAKEDSYNKGK